MIITIINFNYVKTVISSNSSKYNIIITYNYICICIMFSGCIKGTASAKYHLKHGSFSYITVAS